MEVLQTDRHKNKRQLFQMTNLPEFIFQCFVHCRFKTSMTLQECPDATKFISFLLYMTVTKVCSAGRLVAAALRSEA